MIIHKELKEFEMYLMKKNRSKKTIVNYLNDIRYMLKFTNKPVNKITNDDLYLYKYHMINELEFETSSVNRKIVAINQFFKFLNINIFIEQEKVHFQNFLDNLLSSDDINKMIDVATAKRDYRFLAIIHTLRLTGMRVSELLQLKVSDITNDTVQIIGKGGKRRNVFLPKKLKDHLVIYSQYRKNNSDKLFTGQRGEIRPATVDRLIKKYGKLCNIDFDKLHAHNLRHVYAKRLAEKVNIEVVADILGHSSLNTTRIYLKSTKEEILKIVNDID